MSCLATGVPPINYIWQKDGQFLGNQTSATLLITNAQMADASQYAAVASNGEGLERSQAAQVIVYTNQPCNFPWACMRKFRSATPACNARVEGLACDSQGNVFVTGTATMLGTDPNFLTLKLDPAGRVLWTAVYDDPSEVGAVPNDICLDEHGNVYVTGSYSQTGVNQNYLTIKYGPNGEQLWTARFDSGSATEPNESNDVANSIVVGDAGCVYVSGNRGTVKYDPEGNQLWMNSSGQSSNAETAQWSASDGALVACGQQSVSKIASSGTNLWQVTVGNAPYLTLDGDGNVYVARGRDFNWQAGRGDI